MTMNTTTPEIPSKGQWYTRQNATKNTQGARYASCPQDVICLVEVNAEKDEIHVRRWDGAWHDGEPVFVRRSTMSLKTWRDRRRYLTQIEAPKPPAPTVPVQEALAPTEPPPPQDAAPTTTETHAEIVALRGDVAKLQKTVDALVGMLATRPVSNGASQLGLPISNPVSPS